MDPWPILRAVCYQLLKAQTLQPGTCFSDWFWVSHTCPFRSSFSFTRSPSPNGQCPRLSSSFFLWKPLCLLSRTPSSVFFFRTPMASGADGANSQQTSTSPDSITSLGPKDWLLHLCIFCAVPGTVQLPRRTWSPRSPPRSGLWDGTARRLIAQAFQLG